MVDRIVFDIELVEAKALRETRRADKRREPGVESRARLTGNRQQLAITPEIFRTTFDFVPRDLDCVVIVVRLERAQTFLADVQRFGREFRLTQMTLQTEKCAHAVSLICRNWHLTAGGM